MLMPHPDVALGSLDSWFTPIIKLVRCKSLHNKQYFLFFPSARICSCLRVSQFLAWQSSLLQILQYRISLFHFLEPELLHHRCLLISSLKPRNFFHRSTLKFFPKFSRSSFAFFHSFLSALQFH